MVTSMATGVDRSAISAKAKAGLRIARDQEAKPKMDEHKSGHPHHSAYRAPDSHAETRALDLQERTSFGCEKYRRVLAALFDSADSDQLGFSDDRPMQHGGAI